MSKIKKAKLYDFDGNIIHPETDFELPEGGKSGEVLTKGTWELKNSYTYDELENFYGNLETNDYKGIFCDRDSLYYNLDVYCDLNSDDSKYFHIYYEHDDLPGYTYKCNVENFEDGWYDQDDNKISDVPELIIPDYLDPEYDYENISDIDELNDIIFYDKNLTWSPGIPKGGKDGQVLSKIIKSPIQETYDYKTLVDWYKRFDPSLSPQNEYVMITADELSESGDPVFDIVLISSDYLEDRDCLITIGVMMGNIAYLYISDEMADLSGLPESGWYKEDGNLEKIPSIKEIFPDSYLSNPDWYYQDRTDEYADGTLPKISDFVINDVVWKDVTGGVDVSKVNEYAAVVVTGDVDENNKLIPGSQKLTTVTGGNAGDVLTIVSPDKIVRNKEFKFKDTYTSAELWQFLAKYSWNIPGETYISYHYSDQESSENDIEIRIYPETDEDSTESWIHFEVEIGYITLLYITPEICSKYDVDEPGWYYLGSGGVEQKSSTPTFFTEEPDDEIIFESFSGNDDFTKIQDLASLLNVRVEGGIAWTVGGHGSGLPEGGKDGDVLVRVGESDAAWSDAPRQTIGGVLFTTTAPEEDNPNGIKLAILSEEPTTYKNGYLYIISDSEA